MQFGNLCLVGIGLCILSFDWISFGRFEHVYNAFGVWTLKVGYCRLIASVEGSQGIFQDGS